MRAKIIQHPATETEIIYVATLADGTVVDSDELCSGADDFNCAAFHADHMAALLRTERVTHIRGVAVPSWRAIRNHRERTGKLLY